MSTMEQLVGNVIETDFSTFDQETVVYAKNRIMDTVGAMIGGVRSSGCDMILDIVSQWGGNEECTILAAGERVPAANGALVMGMMARSNDFEPAGGPEIDGKQFPGHYSATNVPTAFAITEKFSLSGKELIGAIILGDDLAGRIGVSGVGTRGWIDNGWDPSGLCSRFGATAVAGKLIGLNETQMLNAMGIVCSQISGTMAPVFDFTHTFKINQGIAAWNGILSAELALRGFTGPKDPLTGKFGYYRQFCQEVDPEILTRDLGKKFYADEEFKLYPCCRGNAGSIETVMELVQSNDMDADDIEEINIDLSPEHRNSFLLEPFEDGDFAQAKAILNLRYNVASAFIRKSVRLEHYTEESIGDPKVLEFANKITFNTTLTGKRMSSRVRVKTKNGRELSAFTETPRGDIKANPITKEEIKNKFRENAYFSKAISKENAEKGLDLLDRLEELEDVNDLVKTLIP